MAGKTPLLFFGQIFLGLNKICETHHHEHLLLMKTLLEISKAVPRSTGQDKKNKKNDYNRL